MTFMLLIFFLLITHFSDSDQIELNVSDKNVKASSAPTAATGQAALLVVRLLPEGAEMDGEFVPYASLQPMLKSKLGSRPVSLIAGPGVTLQQFVSALDAAKLAGAADITLNTEP